MINKISIVKEKINIKLNRTNITNNNISSAKFERSPMTDSISFRSAGRFHPGLGPSQSSYSSSSGYSYSPPVSKDYSSSYGTDSSIKDKETVELSGSAKADLIKNCEDVRLSGSAHADNIKGGIVLLKEKATADNIDTTDDVTIKDNAVAETVITNIIRRMSSRNNPTFATSFWDAIRCPSLYGNAQITKLLKSEQGFSLYDSSSVKEIISNTDENHIGILDCNSYAEKITANHSIILRDNAKANDITITKENQDVELHGNSNVTGTITFEKGGYVFVNSDKEGNIPQIKSEQVINGEIILKDLNKLVQADLNKIKDIQPVNIPERKQGSLSSLNANLNITENMLKEESIHKEVLLKKLISDNNAINSINIENKNIKDFWIDIVDGEGTAKELSTRQKTQRLEEIAETPEEVDIVFNKTLEYVGKNNKSIKNTQKAYTNLIESAELDNEAQNILKSYQDSELLFYAVTGFSKNTSSVTNLERSTQEILDQLTTHRHEAVVDFRENVLIPANNINDLYMDKNKKDLPVAILTYLKSFGDKESKKQIATLQYNVEQNVDSVIKKSWEDILTTTEDKFKTTTLNQITANDIELLFETSRALKTNPDEVIRKTLTDKHLDIEEKHFVARYKDDENLLNVLKKPAIDKNDAIAQFMSTEKLNNLMLGLTLNAFIDGNITPQLVKDSSLISDFYLEKINKNNSALSLEQKTKILQNVPKENLMQMNREFLQRWNKEILPETMHETFLNTVQTYDADYNSSKVLEKLNEVNININNQHVTLLEFAKNMEKYSANLDYKLDDVLMVLKEIKGDTGNIKNNVKILMNQAIQNEKNTEKRAELVNMVQDIDRDGLISFLEKAKSADKDEANKKIRNIAIGVGLAGVLILTAGAAIWLANPATLGCPALAAKATTVGGALTKIGITKSATTSYGMLGSILIAKSTGIDPSKLLSAIDSSVKTA